MKQAAVMIIVNSEGYILGVPRKEDPNKWGLAGGKVDHGETTQQAALRETEEETGIKVGYCRQVYSRKEINRLGIFDTTFITVCFYADTWKGEISTTEGQPKWLFMEQFTDPKTGAFPEYNEKAFAALQKMIPDLKLKSINDLSALEI